MVEFRRGDVVLVSFPFVRTGSVERKRRPAVVVQADKYNRRRAAVVLAAITSARAHHELPCKIFVPRHSSEGRRVGLKTDSTIDCQTLVTIPKDQVVRRLGAFAGAVLDRIDRALKDALGLADS